MGSPDSTQPRAQRATIQRLAEHRPTERSVKPAAFLRAAGLQPFASFLTGIGAPTEALWAAAGLPARALHDPGLLVPLRLAVHFGETAARAEGIPALGLVVAQRHGIAALGEFGARLRQAPTLSAALRIAQNESPILTSGARFWTAPAPDGVRLHHAACWRDQPCRQADLYTLQLMLELVAAAAGPGWRPRAISLKSGGGNDVLDPEVFADCVVTNDARTTSVTIPGDLLVRPMRWAPPAAEAGAAPTGARWSSNAPPVDFLGSMRALTRALLESRRADVATAAEAVGTSRRSLQRKLAESGVSFSELVDEARFELARERLATSDVKIIEVAFDLGYSDPAHFTRAFRRWATMSPHEYRRLQRGEVGGVAVA